MKANFLSVLQKTLCILPIALTLAFGHSLVVSAAEHSAEISIQINVSPSQSKHQTTLRFVMGNPIYTVNDRYNMSGAVPFIDPIYNRAMVPLHVIEEALELSVDVDTNMIEGTHTITIIRGDINVSLKIGESLPDDMGAPIIIGERIFVPASYVAQMLGIHIRWDSSAQAIYMKDFFERSTFDTSLSVELIQLVEPAEPRAIQTCGQTALHAVYIHAFECRVLELANAERARYGLTPLVWNDSLARAASSHSRDMARNDFVCHTGSDGATPGVRAVRAGVTGMVYVAENIAAGTRTPERTIEAWMGSEKHRNNILNASFRYFGVGVYHLDGSEWEVYTTQKFGR